MKTRGETVVAAFEAAGRFLTEECWACPETNGRVGARDGGGCRLVMIDISSVGSRMSEQCAELKTSSNLDSTQTDSNAQHANVFERTTSPMMHLSANESLWNQKKSPVKTVPCVSVWRKRAPRRDRRVLTEDGGSLFKDKRVKTFSLSRFYCNNRRQIKSLMFACVSHKLRQKWHKV